MICCIDPGTTNTGIVWMKRDEVIASDTIHFPHSIKNDNYELMDRVAEIVKEIDTHWLHGDQGALEAVVIEGYVGGWANRNNAYTYQTPWLVGALLQHMRQYDQKRFAVYIQTSAQVLNPRTPGNAAWVKYHLEDGKLPIGGAEKCTNDHERSALAHGIWFYSQPENGDYE